MNELQGKPRQISSVSVGHGFEEDSFVILIVIKAENLSETAVGDVGWPRDGS